MVSAESCRRTTTRPLAGEVITGFVVSDMSKTGSFSSLEHETKKVTPIMAVKIKRSFFIFFNELKISNQCFV
jgi:hypothetical protein